MTSTDKKKLCLFQRHPKLFGLGGAILGIAVIFGIYKFRTSKLPIHIVNNDTDHNHHDDDEDTDHNSL